MAEYLDYWISKEKNPENIADDMVGFSGENPQDAWEYLTDNHPTQAISYPGLAYVAFEKYKLGSSASMPNITLEVNGIGTSEDVSDINPADIITPIIKNTQFGLCLDADIFDVETYYRTFCDEMDFLMSIAFDSQKAANEHLEEILDASFSSCRLHDGETIEVIPLRDSDVGDWEADITPKYYLTDDDFICDDEEDPVRVTRKTPADMFNSVPVEYRKRSKSYNTAEVSYSDLANITVHGLRQSDVLSYHCYKTAARAKKIAQLKCHYYTGICNEYEFKLPVKYCLLEALDVVAISDEKLGLDEYPVRIRRIDEDDFEFMVTAEDLPGQTLSIGDNDIEVEDDSEAYVPDQNIDPGSVNAPVLFVPPDALITSTYEAWCAVSGVTPDNWGGCDVYISTDGGTSYNYVTTKEGPSRHGELTAAFASGSDPDTTNTCSVDLSESEGELTSAAISDADNRLSLALVGDEIIAFSTATLAAEYNYDLTTYIRRGVYNTEIEAHASGDKFVRIDDELIKLSFNSSLVDQTIYIKFASFNIYGGNTQGLADCTAYSITLAEPTATAIQDITAASGAVVVDNSGSSTDTYKATVTAESGTTGEITQISGVAVGKTVVLKAASGQTITVTRGDYLRMPSNFTLSGYRRISFLVEEDGICTELGRSANL